MTSTTTTTARVTPEAVTKLKELCGEAVHPILHLYVAGRTCCGLRYGLEFTERVPAGSLVSDFDELSLVVDPDSSADCDRAVIDYVVTERGAAFTVESPATSAACHCAQS